MAYSLLADFTRTRTVRGSPAGRVTSRVTAVPFASVAAGAHFPSPASHSTAVIGCSDSTAAASRTFGTAVTRTGRPPTILESASGVTTSRPTRGGATTIGGVR